MNKIVISLSCLTSILGVSYYAPKEEQFNYQYEIRANSNSMSDQMMLYTYKKILISTYEELCLDIAPEQHATTLINNIDKFKIEGKSKAYLKFGTLVMVVGSGLGPSIKGSLRKSTCDEDPIDTRFFIFDLFGN